MYRCLIFKDLLKSTLEETKKSMGCFADVNCKYTMKIPDRNLESRSHTSANLFIFELSRKYSVKIEGSKFNQNRMKIVVQHGQESTLYFCFIQRFICSTFTRINIVRNPRKFKNFRAMQERDIFVCISFTFFI